MRVRAKLNATQRHEAAPVPSPPDPSPDGRGEDQLRWSIGTNA